MNPTPSTHGDVTPSAIEPAASPGERLARQRRLLAAREAANTGLESAAITEESMAADAPVPHPDDVFARIDSLIKRMPPSEIGDPAEFRKALELLHRHGDPALRKLVDPAAGQDATMDEIGALEAIVIADGSRPSFLLKDGLPPIEHPFLGTWADDIAVFRADVKTVAIAVGRVQPAGGHASRYVGSASLVDRAKGLALTNYHVLDDARTKLKIAMIQTDRTVKIVGDLELDFVGEADNPATNRFKVVEAMLPENFGRGFGHVDAAVLRIEPVNAQSVLPARAVTFSAVPDYMTGDAARLASLCTIGFPGPPPATTGKTGEVDWSFVTAKLFANRFGFKRLAPGRFSRSLASDNRDTPKIVFGHDATTFGGASGSPIIAWKDAGPPAFGLHFAGTTESANHAISAAAAADALRSLGVPLQ